MTPRRHDPNSWTVVPLPERDLGDVVLELAAPLIERLGPVDSTEDARRAIELAVTFWNASVLASQLGRNTSLIFPVDRHRSAIGEDGIVTVYAAMPAALQLFAEGRLPAVGGAAVELAIGSRKPGAMVLAELRCGGEDHRHDIAVLVFRPAHAKVST